MDEYNTRDNLVFTNTVAKDTVNAVSDIVDEKVNSLSEKILQLFKSLNADKEKIKELGISFEEKAFYDVLVNVRDTHGFEYDDERCIELAKKIKLLVDDVTIYADFANNNNLKSKLSIDLTYLIYKEGYPPQWDQEVFQKVLEQVENYKNHE
ncbi:type I restriction enzyme endonuclease domain-containing protein [Prevotellamassilia timonensis]|uniref:type I restriction enzyme endonuclease domain-containing protein n=1 Tax=Prevotellamassilia timonensis TaxID=1852370 RepID=UPI00307A94B7